MRLIVRGSWWLLLILLLLLHGTNVSEAFGSSSRYLLHRQCQEQEQQHVQVGGGIHSLQRMTTPTQTQRQRRNSRVWAMSVSWPPVSSSSVIPQRTTRRSWATDTTWNQYNSKTTPFDEDDALAMLIENWEQEHDYLTANQYPPSQSRLMDNGLGNNDDSNDRYDYPTKPALRLVHTVAKLMSKGQKSDDWEDEFIQEGIVALLQAMHHYPRLVAAAAAAAAAPTTSTTNLLPLSFEEYAARHIIMEMTRQAPPDIVAAAAATAAATMTSNRSSQPSRRTKMMELHERPRTSEGIVGNRPDITVPDRRVVSDDHDWYDKRHAMMMENINLQWDDDNDDEPIWMNPLSYHPSPQTTATTTTTRTMATTTTTTTSTTVRDSILTVVDRDELTPEDDALQAMIRSDVQTACREILNDVEFQVIRMHFGLEGEQRALSWREMAKRLKTTKEFVRSISEQAMAKLRRPGASRSIEPYREEG